MRGSADGVKLDGAFPVDFSATLDLVFESSFVGTASSVGSGVCSAVAC